MEILTDKLKEAGINISEETEKADIKAFPHYRGNIGFYHIVASDWEIALIKGVFKQNIRRIKGEAPYDDKKINKLAQTLADAERNLRQPVTIELFFEDDTYYITSAEPSTPHITDDMRDYSIKQPITDVEKSLGKSDFAMDKHLFIRAPFAEIAPETLSPVSMSIASNVPDVFNPLFMSCSIKTQSPSLKLLFGRLYLNLANAETVIPAFKQTPDLFLMNFASAIFGTIKKPTFGIPDDSDLNIADTEIEDAISDIKSSTEQLDPDNIFDESFTELTALSVMAWEMVYIRLWKSFTSTHKTIGKDISTTLKYIYMTRSDSILGSELSISPTIDPADKPVEIKGCNINHKTIDEMYRTLPTSKKLTLSRTKYTERIQEAHTYLKMRDELYINIMELTAKLRELLLDIGKQLLDENRITDINDIFFFEMSELKNIINDEFYGNIPFTINFRKWQSARFSALCVPFNIYEKDIEQIEEISAAQMDKSIKDRQIPCISFFHKDDNNKKINIKRVWMLSEISEAESADAIVSESAGLFSFITEYCASTDKPLYAGARFANVIAEEITETHENYIRF